MNMRKTCLYILTATLLFIVADTQAQESRHDSEVPDVPGFERYFEDRTLRLDYIFAGNAEKQAIYLDKLSVEPRWYGKRQHLSEVPMEGNGQVVVTDYKSGRTIYRNSFSTLFQEWLTYDEAKQTSRSFENVFLVPMPKDSVRITVRLMNNRRETMTEFTHVVDPHDILIRKKGFNHRTPYSTLQQAEDTTRCIRIAYVAEGYTESEMSSFVSDAKAASEALFAHEPFKSMRGRFNIVAVMSPSEESGASEPSEGIWRKTALSSHFDTFYSDRYLTTLNLFDLHDWLAGIPYEHIIVLVNTEKYGGGGILNSYNLAMTKNEFFKPVVVHEFGHSFIGLADEYAYEEEAIPMYPHDVEPWEPNITTLVDFHGKWEHLIGKTTPVPTPPDGNTPSQVGVYEGAGYSLKGVYRGVQDCRMRTNQNPEFCIVCRQAIQRVIDFYTKQ